MTDPREIGPALDRAVLRTVRGFLKAGRKSWSGPLAVRRYAAVKAQMDALDKVDPLLAAYAERCIQFAVQLLVTSRKRRV